MDAPRPTTGYDDAKCQSTTIRSSSSPKWNRAIPESGYIRLGSIRYGVKMTVTENGTCAPLKQPITAASVAAAASPRASCSSHSDASTCGDGDSFRCCCLGTNSVLAAGTGNNNQKAAMRQHAENRIQQPSSSEQQQQQQQHTTSSSRPISETTTTTSTSTAALSRSHSRATSTQRSQPSPKLVATPTTTPTATADNAAAASSDCDQSSQTLCARRSTTSTTPSPSIIGGHLVIGSRESSPTPPTTCCYYYTVPTRIAQPFKPAAAVVSGVGVELRHCSSSAPLHGRRRTQPHAAAHQPQHGGALTTSTTPLLSSSSSSSAPHQQQQQQHHHYHHHHQRPSAPQSISERLVGASEFNYSSHRNSAESSADALSSRLLLGPSSAARNDDHEIDDDEDVHDGDHDNNGANDHHPLPCVKRAQSHHRHHQVQRTFRTDADCYCHNKAAAASDLHDSCRSNSSETGRSSNNNNTSATNTIPTIGDATTTTCRDYINRSTAAYQNHKPRQIFGNDDGDEQPAVDDEGHAHAGGGADTAALRRKITPPNRATISACSVVEPRHHHLWPPHQQQQQQPERDNNDDDDDDRNRSVVVHTQITQSPACRNGDNSRAAALPAAAASCDYVRDAAADQHNNHNNRPHHKSSVAAEENDDGGDNNAFATGRLTTTTYNDLSFIDSSVGDFSTLNNATADDVEVRQQLASSAICGRPHTQASQSPPPPPPPPPPSTVRIHSGIPKPSLLDSSSYSSSANGPKINSVTLKSRCGAANNKTGGNDDARHSKRANGDVDTGAADNDAANHDDRCARLLPSRRCGGINSFGAIRTTTVRLRSLVTDTVDIEQAELRARGRQLVAEEVFPQSVSQSSCYGGGGGRSGGTSGNSLLPAAMDKRRKTLDRWQRLGFGRRSASNISSESLATAAHSSGASEGRKSSPSVAAVASTDKTERLKELTEMLKSSRTSAPAAIATAAPPVPPPRKPRSPHPSASNSGSLASLNVEEAASAASQHTTTTVITPPPPPPAIPSSVELPRKMFQDSLKALRSFRSSHQDVRVPATVATVNELPAVHPNKFHALPVDEEDTFDAPLPSNVELRNSLSAHPTAKHIPHRSASFSQVDYSSGKYIRSALGALKASIMSNKHKEPSVVDSANLTLPRKKDAAATSSRDEELPADDSVSYIFLTDKPDRHIGLLSSSPPPPPSPASEEPPPSTACSPLVVVNAAEIVLDTLCEEEICHQPAQLCDEEFLQTATTCLIPVPVYECVGRDWPCAEDEPEVWQNVNEDEGVKHIEEYNVNTERITSAEIRMEIVGDSLPVLDEEQEEVVGGGQQIPSQLPLIDIQTADDGSMMPISAATLTAAAPSGKHKPFERANTWSCPVEAAADQLPAISVTSGSSNEFDDSSTIADETKPHPDSPDRLSTEFVEVRKRHSNEDKPFESSLESINPSPSEERKRIDKSKRRKGIYIQWPLEDKAKTEAGECWSLAGQDANSPIPDATTASIWSVLSGCGDADTDALNPLALVENLAQFGCKPPADGDRQSPQSALGSLEPTTPDSENSGRLQWPKRASRQSLTCQSSEEKDDVVMPQPSGALALSTAASSWSAASTASPAAAATPDTQHRTLQFLRSDSVSDTEFDRTVPRERCSQSPGPADTDLKRFSKRPLRGPYGQMLEATMKKPDKLPYDEILEELNRADSAIKRKESDDYLRQQKLVRKNSGYLPVPCHVRASSTPVHMDTNNPKEPIVSHHRRFPSCIDSTTDLKKEFKKMSLDSSVPKEPLRPPKKCTSLETNINTKRSSKDESKSQFTVHRKDNSSPNTLKATPELLAQLLKGSSEKLVAEQFERRSQPGSGESITLPTALLKCLDTRTHIVIELFNTETSYVESLGHVAQKYMQPLRSAEYAGLVDKQTVDEIFYMIPALQRLHERFLDDLQQRLNAWSESQSQVGVAFIDAFSDSDVFDTYMTFLNNLNRATTTLRTARLQRPAFAKFLDATARQHKGKLELDSLLIKPVQKFPSYELILSRMIKYTADDHPDSAALHKAFNLVHDMLVTLNCKKREEFEKGQREAVVREIEGVIEGVSDLVTPDRQFLLFDLVSIVPASHTGRKDRGLFLFNDLLIVTSIKRRSGNIRKPNSTCPNSVALTLDTNKYKLIMKIPIDDLDIVKIKDESLQKLEREIEFLANDLKKLHQIVDVANTLRCPHQALEECTKELQRDLQRQLTDRQTNDPQLSILDLSLHSSTELLSWSVMFTKADKKTQWEQTLLELKLKIAASLECPPAPDFLTTIPIRKTRAGLQFTCAAPTLGGSGGMSDVWVCNSDGYVGQVCVLSLTPEASVTSCNSVCNARIMCLQSVPHSSQQQQQRSPEAVGAGSVETAGSQSLPDLSSSGDETDETATVATSGSASGGDIGSTAKQSTMWLGMEDGYVHVYNCSDNIRIKNTKIKIAHGTAVTDILYLDDQIFVALANGDVAVYRRENDIWQTAHPRMTTVGTVAQPVTQILRVNRSLWCSAHGTIKMLDTEKLTVDYEFRVSDKPITNMVLCGDKVWLSVKNSAFVECYHCTNFNLLHKVNLAPQVTKMLFGCDEIIRQHKAACLRVTSMLSCKNLVWIGTSAGVVLTVRTVEKATAGVVELPIVTGLPHGHTGHVRVLTSVEYNPRADYGPKDLASKPKTPTPPDTQVLLVISGGDGYENFRPTGTALNDSAGREDSTNHLLIWQC